MPEPGNPADRIDGRAKVTGAAQYATDYAVKNMVYAAIFKSEIAAGKIIHINTATAERSPGVLTVLTYKNAPKVKETPAVWGGGFLQTTKIDFYGQHIGVVVAETFEQATHAAKLIKVNYEKAEAKVDFKKHEGEAVKAKGTDRADAIRGDAEAAFSTADHKTDAVYHTPIEHHQPMEPHATIAVWESADKLVLYNPAQVVNGMQNAVAGTFSLKPADVRIITPYIGGGFGSKGTTWGNIILAAMAAKAVSRPVKLALTRQQMFNSVGLRQENKQHLRLAASDDGKLTALAHETTTHTAVNSEYIEPCGDCSKLMYSTPNSLITYRVVPMNIIKPSYTRGPGKAPGSFALESAMDELAHQLKMDPIEFRLKNEPDKDPSNGKPWSSRSLVQCLQTGAKRFGWEQRRALPGQVHKDGFRIGYGVGCGTYPVNQRDSSAYVKLTGSGTVVNAIVEMAASDLGTGTYTILAQTASAGLGIPMKNITVKIGDSVLPPAAGSVGSVGAISFSNALNDACVKITNELMAKAGKQFPAGTTAAQIMISENIADFETRSESKAPEEAKKYSSHSFNANFAEVWVNEATGMVKVKRFLAVTAAGKIINQKTASSQIIGGIVWGIGMALTEESVLDPRYGNFVTRSLGDYHIPANLDIGEIETLFIDEDDKLSNTLGIKGIGEVSIVGVAGAIANAVFNATGKRVRSLPITPDKLI